MSAEPWNRETFILELRAVGARAYHDKHPFHVRMNAGELSPGAIRHWVANRYYYQRCIPQKDAAIVSNCPLREVRRIWLHRIIDHDGTAGTEGGIEAWLRLGEACDIPREELLLERHVLAGVRFAVDAYVNFARTQPWPIAVASSLTELFAPELMATRMQAFEEHYKWVKPWGFDYFDHRRSQARRDAEEGLQLTLQYCTSRDSQDAAIRALSFKCDVLWAVLDTICHSNSASEGAAFETPQPALV
jgi:pyrroloquinoline-quinone synthase